MVLLHSGDGAGLGWDSGAVSGSRLGFAPVMSGKARWGGGLHPRLRLLCVRFVLCAGAPSPSMCLGRCVSERGMSQKMCLARYVSEDVSRNMCLGQEKRGKHKAVHLGSS